LTDTLALIVLMFQALVPLFWIPVHGFSNFFRKLGIFTYITPFITWLPVAWLIYSNRELLLSYRLDLPAILRALGWIVFVFGGALQVWTLRLLKVWGIMGLPEVTRIVESRIITTGPFSVVRHPTYLSHTIMYAGVFLITGVAAVAVITLLDIIVVNALVIPLEDRELIERFGEEYRDYRKRVPAFFPGIKRK
jgi:protein-S-isoprenylcysteine O-methyltransferase Ste14